MIIGRADELAFLDRVLARAEVGAVILRGAAGAGKTALAEAALERLADRGGFGGVGKYAQGAQAPFTPILAALRHAAARALESLYDAEAARASLAQALGDSRSVLAGMGFDLAPAAPDARAENPAGLGERESAARVVQGLARLARWVAAFGRPWALLIDDWGRGSGPGRDFLLSLAADAPALRLTLLLTERPRKIEPLAHPPQSPDAAPGEVLEVGPLALDDRLAVLRALVGDAAEAVFTWFGGSPPSLPFDLCAAARALLDAGALVKSQGRWSVDAARAAGVEQGDIAAVLAKSIDGEPRLVRDLAVAMALLGEGTDVVRLSSALGEPADDCERALARLEGVGLIGAREPVVALRHDRLRRAVLTLASEPPARLAASMAERLRGSGPEAPQDVLRLRLAGGIAEADPDLWLAPFALGARNARAAADVVGAAAFAQAAQDLRARGGRAVPSVERVTMEQSLLAAADRAEAAAVIVAARSLIKATWRTSDWARGLELAIAALSRANNADGAWDLARQGLARLGGRLPPAAGAGRLLAAFLRWNLRRLRPPRAGSFAGPIDDYTRIANAAAVMAWERSPQLAALVGFEGSARAPASSRNSPFWLSTDAFLCSTTGNRAAAARLGARAAEEAQSLQPTFARAASLYRGLYFGQIWSTPIAELRDRCLTVRDIAISEGDLTYAVVSLRNWLMIGWRTVTLPQLRSQIASAQQELARYGEGAMSSMVAAVTAASDFLSAPARDTRSRAAAVSEIGGINALVGMECAAALGEWAAVIDLAVRFKDQRRGQDSHPGGVIWRFLDSLARIELGRSPRRADRRFLLDAARLNPADHAGKVRLLQALRSEPSARAAVRLEEAVARCGHSSYRLDEPLAARAAAAFFARSGDAAAAQRFAARADAAWAAWGVTALAASGQQRPPPADELAEAHSRIEAAERTARARSRFLADVAHELRTPLQSLQALLDLAQSDPARLDLPTFSEVFASLKSVVHDLTDLGAVASGQAPLELSAIDLADLVRSEAAAATPLAAQKGSKIDLILPTAPTPVLTDGPRVRQVVRNLLSNACKYGAGGPITVGLGSEPAPSGKQRIVLTVDDRGPGLTQADRVRLFEPFERGERAGDGQGLGLGLAVSRGIAHSLGGALDVADRDGGGARFELRFTAAVAPPLANGSPPPPAGPGLQILLAEDSEMVRRLVAAVLAADGHQVWEAASLERARAALENHEFDLVVADLFLSGGDATGFIAQAAAAAAVIVLTASSDLSRLAEARRAGAQLVLRKPASAADLRAAIATATGAGTALAREPAEEEIAALEAQARIQVRCGVRELLQAGGRASASDAHRLSGLAAQFGHADIAEALDLFEADLRGGMSTTASAARLARALAAVDCVD